MKLQYLLVVIVAALAVNILISCNFANRQSDTNPELKVLVITSGHQRFDSEAFFGMIFSLKGISADTISQPLANQAMLSDSILQYDAILFFDMWQDITDAQKDAFLSITENGTGLVFLHHTLVSYQEWSVFTEIIGGKYYHDRYDYPPEKYSTYKHDITMEVEISNQLHPITSGLENFVITDEGYGNIMVLPDVVPILTTNHPDCTDIIAWTNTYNNSRVVYILPGHGSEIFSNPAYRQIIINSLKWSIME
jgi:uncharacterized protein